MAASHHQQWLPMMNLLWRNETGPHLLSHPGSAAAMLPETPHQQRGGGSRPACGCCSEGWMSTMGTVTDLDSTVPTQVLAAAGGEAEARFLKPLGSSSTGVGHNSVLDALFDAPQTLGVALETKAQHQGFQGLACRDHRIHLQILAGVGQKGGRSMHAITRPSPTPISHANNLTTHNTTYHTRLPEHAQQAKRGGTGRGAHQAAG